MRVDGDQSTDTSLAASAKDIASIERCRTQDTVRNFKNGLYTEGEDGQSHFTGPPIEYSPLNTHSQEARLLILHPTADVAEHVCCDVETHPLEEIPAFIAIKNARGYRNLTEAIEIAGRTLLISIALERFLRYLRTRIEKPTPVWVRYACVMEGDPEEQAAYWTREFSDKMYAMASHVFDMHEVNSRLIENGYFEKVIDARYAKRKKEWYGRRSEVVLPRVCPVRLGTKPDFDKPTMEFQYMPLDMVVDEIRVMCIMPAEDTAAPIVIHVSHCPIKCEATFFALSCESAIM
jgi:hypothetical protein